MRDHQPCITSPPTPILTKVWRYIPEPICMYTYISNFSPDENFTLFKIHRKMVNTIHSAGERKYPESDLGQ